MHYMPSFKTPYSKSKYVFWEIYINVCWYELNITSMPTFPRLNNIMAYTIIFLKNIMVHTNKTSQCKASHEAHKNL